MKTIYITHQFFPYFYTGTELLTGNLSTYMRKLAVETEVWTYNLESKNIHKIEETNYNGVPVKFFSHHNNLPNRDKIMFWKNEKKTALFKKIISKTKPDLIHVTHSARMGDIVACANELGIPYVVTITDYWLICPTANLIKINGDLCSGTVADPDCLKFCYRNDKKLLNERWSAVTDFLKNASSVNYAADFVKLMFEKNGINTKSWNKIKHGYNTIEKRKRIQDKNYRFAFTGTLQPSKGAHLTIEAFKTLPTKEARLVIYGETKHDEEYSKYCLDLAKKDERISFRGRYDHTKLVEEFKDIDCIIIPSNWYEPFPFTLIAAVSHGFEVIGAKIGGIPEIIGDKNAESLFIAGDSKDLAEKMTLKLQKDKKSSALFYDQNIEGESFNYFQIYNYLLANEG